MARPLLLDTCAIIWIASDLTALTPEALSAIEDAQTVYYSPISAWEIALKAAFGRLTLPLTPREWFRRVVAHHGLEPIPLREDILFQSADLPRHHRDPADRLIIATAIIEGLPVVTGDTRFPAYGIETML